MPAPTIGRKVYYRPSSIDFSLPLPIYDATVVGINEDGTVNLACHDHQANPFAARNIQFFDDDGSKLVSGQAAHWMPYQAQQHEKAAAMESAVAAGQVHIDQAEQQRAAEEQSQ